LSSFFLVVTNAAVPLGLAGAGFDNDDDGGDVIFSFLISARLLRILTPFDGSRGRLTVGFLVALELEDCAACFLALEEELCNGLRRVTPSGVAAVVAVVVVEFVLAPVTGGRRRFDVVGVVVVCGSRFVPSSPVTTDDDTLFVLRVTVPLVDDDKVDACFAVVLRVRLFDADGGGADDLSDLRKCASVELNLKNPSLIFGLN